MLLEKINSVKDLRKLKVSELEGLAGEVREYILDVISKNGGHLASSLGVVELTIALHYVFNTPSDKIIWDVGHQSYAHKILTGRREAFRTIRQFGGISGFPKMHESAFDSFDTGHSSTSLTLACGSAIGRDMTGKNNNVIAVIGDGSLTGGMAFEAINQIGHLERDLIIILNDNEHSINENVGALSKYLTRIISGSTYNRIRRKSMDLVKRIPRVGGPLFNFIYRSIESFKKMIIPGQFFEDMGVRYFGPIDGHNIQQLIHIMERVKAIHYGPKIIHVLTKKGKGYLPAEMNPARYHGIGPFDRATGIARGDGRLSYSEIAGKTLAHIARKDRKIVAITAAMKLGTGLYEFEKKWPDRFFDVGIAEQHAVTFAGALTASGVRPFVSIYSTFLQRAVDQLIHDIGIMNLPVRILVDRAGAVGQDGETHQGLFDIGIIKNIPNFMILAPSSGEELRDMIYFAARHDSGPVAIRYPRGGIDRCEFSYDEGKVFVPGKIKKLTTGRDLAIFTFGDMVPVARRVRDLLAKRGVGTAVVNLLTIKPLDVRGVDRVLSGVRYAITLENGMIAGGAGEYLLASVKAANRKKILFCAGFPDEFITHGRNAELFKKYGIDPEFLAKRLLTMMK
ncbi:MAG TPA: 1-deoxy-D-xylulose-5-phosphate synthase [Spirochaetota bacterium]|nr:1-deoxy-D-xylulose-5-phosphate synthase [Spirochaetota bacterium]HPC42979.1 1-deoxy-D-xylulose-5-phosphate synthase [Spirochaetota bacterium]HQF10078.1 1-deoxy-D-xylulose-5-phosphate synthase [Spirochaetota bacterium]HQH98818.1 1-deoxy-D-xylulose-5-phosphate synthase [Spirochaetota bacterium]HQJ70470.1 1-deoxy-D-xylulose-5-phosphate synthase [Spirochaetota bacterium]